MDKTQIRDAATVIVLRNPDRAPAVLMGQRGKDAAFMPGKFVFPGGAVDPVDAQVPFVPINALDQDRLSEDSALDPNTLATAAIRELWEETGQILGKKGRWKDAPQGWRSFAATGHHPNAGALTFFFRAVTPKGRSRRFDARFFLTTADQLSSDPEDFSRAEDELSHLQWVHLKEARNFDLPFITQVVLSELAAHIKRGGTPVNVPFFRNDDEAHAVARLGAGPLL